VRGHPRQLLSYRTLSRLSNFHVTLSATARCCNQKADKVKKEWP
jgi:hypothetical protein